MILSLENQVCSIESAKRLKELGFERESLYYWIQLSSGFWKVIDYWVDEPQVRTFTASELMELLPYEINNHIDNIYFLNVFKTFDQYGEIFGVGYMDNEFYYFVDYCSKDKNLSEALAKMLIHVIEEGVVTV